ncbi:MAG: hypothetical protein QOJ81_894 [Chloroflexota bacterium]|jgi:hypothetical protein|nr:hypothetical protein [Chloroflexota bacterium]
MRIRQVDVAMLDKPKAAAQQRALSPKALARLKQHRQLVKTVGQISGPKDVFEIRLGGDEKAMTMRQRIMRAAEEAKKDIVVRKSDSGWLIGLATPERRSKRGRRRKEA